MGELFWEHGFTPPIMIQREFDDVQQTQANTQIKNWQRIFTNIIQFPNWHSLLELG